jgi:hypothetical protein
VSIVFLVDENPNVASVSLGGVVVGGARSVPDRAARSNSERAAPSARVGNRFSAPQVVWNRSNRCAGARGGARVGRPRWLILIIGRQWRSQVEWFAHAPLAIKAGLAPEIVAELKANKRPANMKPDEAVVYDFVNELSAKHQVSDQTFKRAKELLGEQQVVDLTAVAGTYVTVAMLLAMAEEGVPPGKEPPFKAGEP